MKRIAVLDTGGASALAIARKMRALKVLAVVEDASGLRPGAFLDGACGIVLAGNGLALQADAGAVSSALESGLPILALGRAARILLTGMGGQPSSAKMEKSTATVRFSPCLLFQGLQEADRYFERAEELSLPEGARAIAEAGDGWTAAFSDEARGAYALQFSVESNDPDGMVILKNFASLVCECPEAWTMPAFLENCVANLRASCPAGDVVCAVSGGMMSTVAAAVSIRAFGERAKCVMCDTGLLRKGEAQRVKRMFEEEMGVPLAVADISGEVLEALAGAVDARAKREIVRAALLRALSREGGAVVRGAGRQGAFALVPLAMLFREEARELGELLGLPARLLSRQPFPECGLAARVSGEATPEKLSLLRDVDEAFCGEIEAAGLDKKLWQYYAALARAEDGDYAVILHALVSSDALTGYAFRLPYDLIERAVMRILCDHPNVGGVLYDVTGR